MFEFLILVLLLGLIPVYIYSVKENNFYTDITFMYIFICISNFLKRFIYLSSSSPDYLYYFILLLPDLFFVLILIKSRLKFNFFRLKLVAAFVGVSMCLILLNVNLSTFILTFKASFMYLFLLTFDDKYYELNKTIIIKSLLVFIIISLISIWYGSIQFWIDYLPWERRWGELSPTQMKFYQIENYGFTKRAFSFFSGVTDFGLFLASVFILLATLIKKSYFKIILLVVISYGIFITGSKTIYVALIASYLMFALKKKLNYKLMIAFLVLPIVLIGLVLTPSMLYLVGNQFLAYGGVFASIFNPATLAPRIQIFNDFVSDISPLSFFIGSGLKNYGPAAKTFDNLYLSIINGYGLVGLVILISYIVYFYRNFFKLFEKIKDKNSLDLLNCCFLYNTLFLMSSYTHQGLYSISYLLLFLFFNVMAFSIFKNNRTLIAKNN